MSINPFKLSASVINAKKVIRECESLREENLRLKKELQELSEELSLAYQDALTGLHNRRYFDERIQEELNRTKRDPNYGFSILIIDVNDLKQVNDIHGHQKGDKALKWVARFLERALRQEDICCRLAGDEFVVILPKTDELQCLKLLQRLREEQLVVQQDLPVRIALSIGNATYGKHGLTLETLFERADRAMYQDKRAQKGLDPKGETVLAPKNQNGAADYTPLIQKWAHGT